MKVKSSQKYVALYEWWIPLHDPTKHAWVCMQYGPIGKSINWLRVNGLTNDDLGTPIEHLGDQGAAQTMCDLLNMREHGRLPTQREHDEAVAKY